MGFDKHGEAYYGPRTVAEAIEEVHRRYEQAAAARRERIRDQGGPFSPVGQMEYAAYDQGPSRFALEVCEMLENAGYTGVAARVRRHFAD